MGRTHPIWVICALAACRQAARDAPPAPEHDASPPHAHAPAHAARDPLGLARGTTWHFRGTATRADDVAGVVAQPLAWTTTVASVEEHDGRVVYRVIGWPGDAPDMPARTTFVVVEGGVVHLSLDGSTSEGTAWFRLPLSPGAAPCAEGGEYCWSIEPAGTGFDLEYRTNPDLTVYHLEPGRGVTRYEYHHHGTAEDVVLERRD